MITNHTFYTFFVIVVSTNFFLRSHFIIDRVHHLNKLEDKKGLLVLKRM